MESSYKSIFSILTRLENHNLVFLMEKKLKDPEMQKSWLNVSLVTVYEWSVMEKVRKEWDE